MRMLFLFFALSILVGCGSKTTPPTESAVPLTKEQWQTLPIQVKYEIDTLERLRQSDPKLTEQKAWDKFTREVILPAKKKEKNQ